MRGVSSDVLCREMKFYPCSFHLFCIFLMVYSHAISPLALACSPDVPVAFCCLSFPIVPGSRVTIPVTPRLASRSATWRATRPRWRWRWRWRELQLPARNSHLSHTLVVCAQMMKLTRNQRRNRKTLSSLSAMYCANLGLSPSANPIWPLNDHVQSPKIHHHAWRIGAVIVDLTRP
ncbi:hypothetical protein J3F84DRAFT_283542 [Trichoderma pleuroticola]